MAKTPIHFIGFLANIADDSITKLRFGDGFVIESDAPSIESDFPRDLAPFFRQVNAHWGRCGLDDISPEGSYHVVKLNIAECDATDSTSVTVAPGIHAETHTFVQDKLRLLRLFKEGNVVLAYSFLYRNGNQEPIPSGPLRDCLIVDRTPLALTSEEVPEAQSFIETVTLPLKEPSLQLAFESLDLSYRIHDSSQVLLSLMIAMEVLLGPKDHYGEITHRIARNTAVLLGGGRTDGEPVFEDVKSLYKKRSKIVHEGKRTAVTRQDVLRLRQYVRAAIKEAMNSRMSKEELLKTLNACGFGQRPWRKDVE